MGNILCLGRRDINEKDGFSQCTDPIATAGTHNPGHERTAEVGTGGHGAFLFNEHAGGGYRRHSSPSYGATATSLSSHFGATTDIALLLDPEHLLKDIKLMSALGAGGFGVVYKGTYQGGAAAIKIAALKGDTFDLREGLVSPQLRHPHVVNTMCVRTAVMTREFLDAVLAERADRQQRPSGSASMIPSFKSGDGLGDPRKMAGLGDRHGWHEVFSRAGATPNTRLLLLVQELCDLGTLSRAIRQGVFRPREGRDGSKPVPLHLARRMLLRTAAEVCRGMIHLHEANVIHGDLKPANVLLTQCPSDRRGFTAKIADFGLVRVLQPNASRVESDSYGTVAYCSPEAFNGVFSKKSDVYAFGVMLWEMTTSERPFERMPPGRIMLGVSFQNLRPEWPQEQWPELCALGRSCLAHEPAERPDFRQLEEALVSLEEQLRAESASRRESQESVRSDSRPRAVALGGASRQSLVSPPAAEATRTNAVAGGVASKGGFSMPTSPLAGGRGGGVGVDLLRSCPDVQCPPCYPPCGRRGDSLDVAMPPWTAVTTPTAAPKPVPQ